MVELEAIKERVGRELLGLPGGVHQTDLGFVLVSEGIHFEVSFFEFARGDREQLPDGHPRFYVQFTNVLLKNCPVSDGLCRWVATDESNPFFGSMILWLDEEDGDICDVIVQHRAIGDTLDPLEIRAIANFMTVPSSQLAQDLQRRYGGDLVSTPSDR